MRTARKSEVPRHLVKRDDDIPTQRDEEECVALFSNLILPLLTFIYRPSLGFVNQPLRYLYVIVLDYDSQPSYTDSLLRFNLPFPIPQMAINNIFPSTYPMRIASPKSKKNTPKPQRILPNITMRRARIVLLALGSINSLATKRRAHVKWRNSRKRG